MRLNINEHLNTCHAHVMNVGLGVQSTCMALMSIYDDLPRPDAFIFADTGWERDGTYENLQRLAPLAQQANIPFVIAGTADIKENNIALEIKTELPYFVNPSRYCSVTEKRELFIKDIKKRYYKDKRELSLLDVGDMQDVIDASLIDFDKKVEEGIITDGYKAMTTTMLGRQCTHKYKVRPVQKYCREVLGAKKKTPVGSWIGISTDEWTRMATSTVKYTVLFYPLIDMKMSREDCKQYLTDKDYPIPVKSSCIGCPFHSNATWLEMTDAEIADAADFEDVVNTRLQAHPKLKDVPYYENGVRLHKSMRPIRERPFDKKGTEETERDAVCGAAGCFL